MERAVALALMLLFTVLAKHQLVDGQVFCRSEISLANEACSLRAFPAVRPSVPRQLNESSTLAMAAESGGGNRYEQQSRRGRAGGDDDDDDHEGRRRRHRWHHRGSEMEEEADPLDTACCRRLMALDNACVCQAVARLPAFVTTVRHVVKLMPVEGCHVTFECPGSF